MLLLVLSAACSQTEVNQKNGKETNVSLIQNHSFSNIDEVHTTHLHLDLNVDFQNKRLKGVANMSTSTMKLQKTQKLLIGSIHP